MPPLEDGAVHVWSARLDDLSAAWSRTTLPADELARGGKGGPVEVVLRADGWTEVFETALDSLGAAMHQLDGGNRPKGRMSSVAESLTQRLVAARKRPVAEVVASLRAVDDFVLEMFDHQVAMTDVRVAVPVPGWMRMMFRAADRRLLPVSPW